MGGRNLALVLLLVGFVAAVLAWTLLSGEPAQPSAASLVHDLPAPAVVVDSGVPTGADAAVPEAVAAQTAPGERPQKRRGSPAPKGTDWLIDSLKNSKGFRVRVRAVLLLSRDRTPRGTAALISALDDKHPAVRTAAATSLGRRQGQNVVAALQRTKDQDSSRKVKQAATAALAKLAPGRKAVTNEPAPAPSGPRFYVGVGKVSDPKGVLGSADLAQIQHAVRSRVGGLGSVKLAPSGESSGAARAVLERESRAGFYLDVSVAKLEHDPSSGTSATVSVMVGSYPGRDMRAILKGSARIPGGGNDAKSKLSAVQGAVQSAVRKLPQVMARSTR